MKRHYLTIILNTFFLLIITLSSGCVAVTAVPIPTLHPTPLHVPTSSPTNMPEQIRIKGIVIYSDFENIYAVDLQKQITKVIYRSDFGMPQYFTADNTLYIALPTTQNEEGTWRHQIFELGINGIIGKQLTFVDDMRQVVGFNEQKGYLTYLSEKQSLILLDVKNNKTQVVANHDPNIVFEYILPISWSPNNNKLLYGRFSTPGSSTSPCALFLFDIENNKSIELFPGKTSDMLAEWSPDEKNIALRIESNNQSKVYIFNTETETLKQIPVNEEYAYFEGLSWSSDGEKLIFSTGKTVYLFDLTKDKLEIVAQYSDIAISFTASPDMNMILYEQSNRTRETDLYLFNMLEKQNIKIYSQSSILEQTKILDVVGWSYSPTWSPDGRYFAYFTTPEPNNYSKTSPRPIFLNIYSVETSSSISFEIPTTSGYMVFRTYWTYYEQ